MAPFAHNYLIKNNINCEFALGKAVMKGEGRHNIENLQILKGINSDGFCSPSWLYKNSPLYSGEIQVLLSGKIPDVPVEPVLWVNNRPQGKVVYTSLGHWDDWLLDDFNKLIVNSISYLLENQK